MLGSVTQRLLMSVESVTPNLRNIIATFGSTSISESVQLVYPSIYFGCIPAVRGKLEATLIIRDSCLL